jgi:hypothetical protein
MGTMTLQETGEQEWGLLAAWLGQREHLRREALPQGVRVGNSWGRVREDVDDDE